MAYLTEERARLKKQQGREAIDLAMRGKWEEAVAVNRAIISSFPNDVDTYNRLGRALAELGEYALAREAYQKALELDPYNKIARKNLARLSLLQEKAPPAKEEHRVAPHFFVEETGKAGVVSLVNLAPQYVLAKMGSGEQVVLRAEGKKLVVTTGDGEYLGGVEPKHALRLLRLMEGGNRYSGAIASLENGVRILIKEVHQHPSQAGRLSFPLKEAERFRPYIRDTLIKHEIEEEEPELPQEEETWEETLSPEALLGSQEGEDQVVGG